MTVTQTERTHCTKRPEHNSTVVFLSPQRGFTCTSLMQNTRQGFSKGPHNEFEKSLEATRSMFVKVRDNVERASHYCKIK